MSNMSTIVADVNEGIYEWEHANAISMSLSSSHMHTLSVAKLNPDSLAMY